MDNTEYIEFFDGGTPPLLERLGGKGASLVTMTSVDMPVPPGFVVTTSVFRDFMDTGLAEAVAQELTDLDAEDVAAVDAASEAVRRLITERPVPDHLRTVLDEAYAALQSKFSEASPVAVRSSATAEDLPDASFAGQQDTYLWLNGLETVREHVRACWASLYTSRAITYRIKNGIPDEGLNMAVVVQKMVNAKVAGVAMTLDPANGDRSKITVDASWGVGEMVVSGTVTPDNLQLDKVTLQVISEHIGDKHAEMIPAEDGAGLIETAVDADRRCRLCLDPSELRMVAELAKRAEKHYRSPQDIEWAIDADLPEGENVLLLQSRPETVHSSKPAAKKTTGTGAGIGGFAAGLGFGGYSTTSAEKGTRS